MTDTISKVIGIILAFALLVIVPMTISRMTEDMAAKRLALNEVEAFIDKVTDKASISAYDMDDLLIGVNSHGSAFDVTVTRYVLIAVRDSASGTVKTIYVAADDDINSLSGGGIVYLEQGDAVQVRVEGIGITKGQSLIRAFLSVSEEPFKFSLSGTVR